jgi:hypothetical protein
MLEDQKECAICLGDFYPGVEVSRLACHEDHIYHTDCYDQWISAKNSNDCPLCRKPIDIPKVEKFTYMGV